MTSSSEQIVVKSHVGRDLLQSASLFKNEALVVWEYVSNSLQYVDPGTAPVSRVLLDNRNKRIVVADNGRGMDWCGLQHFFLMHGENIDRKAGRPGRGRFGTGKSAAFGIADLLRITTVRHRIRSKVELTRESIESMRSGDPIPVRELERELPTQESNSTVVEIEAIHLKSLDQSRVIKYVERHLARWPRNATVFVNTHECEYSEPPVASEDRFVPTGILREILGDVELIVKVSRVPLGEELRGVGVYANGVWLETTLAGSEGREMSAYIFGELDVPKLDEDHSPIPPFDVSRSMSLNPSNGLVQTIYAFVGEKVEIVRRRLVADERQRKSTEEAKRLANEAAQIAKVINDDFDAFRARVAKVRAKAVGTVDLDAVQTQVATEGEDVIFGSQVPAIVITPVGDPGRGDGIKAEGTNPPNLAPIVSPGPPDAQKNGRFAGKLGERPMIRGGFQVKFEHMGADSPRAHYNREERAIFINLDHPQVSAARRVESVEDPTFKRLAYEVAFCEYAIALASELAGHDEYMDPSEPIYDIRDTINRIARRAAHLYSQ